MLAESDSRELALELEPSVGPTTETWSDPQRSPSVPERDQPAPSRQISPLVYAGFGAGALGIAVGTVAGVMSLSKTSSARGAVPGQSLSAIRCRRHRRRPHAGHGVERRFRCWDRRCRRRCVRAAGVGQRAVGGECAAVSSRWSVRVSSESAARFELAQRCCEVSAAGSPRTCSAPAGTVMLEPSKSSPIGSACPPRHSARKASVTALNDERCSAAARSRGLRRGTARR